MEKAYKVRDYRFDNFMLNVDTYSINEYDTFLNKKEYQSLNMKACKLRNCPILDETLSEEQEEIFY